MRRGRFRQSQQDQVRGPVRHRGRPQVKGIRPFRVHRFQQPERQVAGLVRRPGRGVGGRKQHPDGVGLRGHPLLVQAVKLSHFGYGHRCVRVVAQNDQRVFRGRRQSHRRVEPDTGMPAARDHKAGRRHDGFRQYRARGHAVAHFADLHPHAAVSPGREPQIHTGQLHGLVQHERLRQRVDVGIRHCLDLPQRGHFKRALAHKGGLRRGTSLTATENHQLGPGGNARRNGERARQLAGIVRRKLAFLRLYRNAVKRDGLQHFAGTEARHLKRHVYLTQIFQRLLRRAHRFRAGAGGRDGLPVLRMIRRIDDLIERTRHRACPFRGLFRPAVHGGRQRGLARQNGERHIRIDLHFSRAVRLFQQDLRREGTRRRSLYVLRQRIDFRRNGQGQKAVDDGRVLLDALVAHGIVQQRVHEQPHARPGFACGHVRFQTLPGNFLQGVFHAGGQSLHV